METNTAVSAIITYGELNGNRLATFTLAETTVDALKALAKEFIKVIPDDPDDYHADVDAWLPFGSANNAWPTVPYTVYNQDDDFFFLSITVLHLEAYSTGAEDLDLAAFNAFVSEYNADPDL